MMNKPTIEEILTPKPEARPRIYAYAIAADSHAGLLKVGQTTRDVQQRVAEQLKTAAIKNYRIELDEPAERADGTVFSDHEVRVALARKGFANVELEWVRCGAADVQTALAELRAQQRLAGGDAVLQMSNMARDADIVEGDIVVTSGFGGNHPGGLVIGNVSEVSLNVGGLLKQAKIVPAVDFGRLEEVMVVADYQNPSNLIKNDKDTNKQQSGGPVK
mgnify:CR=1 FL=1